MLASKARLLAVLALAGAIHIMAAGPASGDLYVNPTGKCSDSYTGLSRTFVSRFQGPWCNPSRCNSIKPQSGSPRTCWIEAGTYSSNNVLDFVNSGLSMAAPLRACAIGGDVRLTGSDRPIDWIIRQDTHYTRIGGCDDHKIIVDGGVEFGAGAGQVEKGEAPESVTKILRGIDITGDDNVLEIDLTRTAGWNGITMRSGAERNTLRINTTQHGTPFYPDGNDFGDTIWVEQNTAESTPLLFDGGATGRDWDIGGHSVATILGGKPLVRGIRSTGSWASIATFDSRVPDGNRSTVISRRATDGHMHDLIFNRSGKPQDQRWQECLKIEGTRTTFSNSVVRNCHGAAENSQAADWSWHVRGGRIAHVVYDNIGGPINDMADWDGVDEGNSDLDDFIYKNIIVLGFAQNPACCGRSTAWKNTLFAVGLTGSMELDDVLQMHGWTIQNSSGNCDDVFIDVYGGANGGRRNLPTWQSLYPSAFTKITCTTDANITEPAASVDVTFGNYLAHYTPAASDSLSIAKGVALTTATAAGTNSRTLPVADASWFPDPIPDGTTNWGNPGVGQWAATGYQIHIEGVGNVTFTDVTINAYPNNAGTITLASPRTWANGANVNYSISAGSTPNRGVKRRVSKERWRRVQRRRPHAHVGRGHGRATPTST